MPPPAIETSGLRKAFGDVVAVRCLNLQVPAGEAFGFLGPNGAGKTTVIKMLLGLTAPTAGMARLLGAPAGDRATRARVGFLPEHFRFSDWLTAEEFLTFHGRLYRVPAGHLRHRQDELLELVGLTPFRHRQLRTFSKGMLQRLGLAQALLNEPELVFLDEPISGLDPIGQRLVRDIIRGLRARGVTVFLNSHLLGEVEITCDRVAFIKHGEVIHIGKLDTLMTGKTEVHLRAGGLTPQMLAGLERWSPNIRAEGERVTLTVPDDEVLPAIAHYLITQGAQLYALTPQRASLEELFVQIVGTDGGL